MVTGDPVLVLDASVTVAWCFEDHAAGYADGILGRLSREAAVVPAIWTLEVANALLVGERKRRLRPADSARFLALLGALPIIVDPGPSPREMEHVLALAREHGLSAYDAAYLRLATTRGLPLATLDDTLKQAAAACGIPPA